MTAVSHGTTQITRHMWTVPAPWPQGAVVRDVHDALAMSTTQAKTRGIDTSYDDWLRVLPRDDEIVFYFETTVVQP